MLLFRSCCCCCVCNFYNPVCYCCCFVIVLYLKSSELKQQRVKSDWMGKNNRKMLKRLKQQTCFYLLKENWKKITLNLKTFPLRFFLSNTYTLTDRPHPSSTRPQYLVFLLTTFLLSISPSISSICTITYLLMVYWVWFRKQNDFKPKSLQFWLVKNFIAITFNSNSCKTILL